MGTVRSGASRSRLSWSCRRAVRPIVRASVAAAEGGARIWDANLGFGACAAQEFRLVDDRDAERLGLLELGPRVGAHDERSEERRVGKGWRYRWSANAETEE